MELFFCNVAEPTEISTLSLHDALPISAQVRPRPAAPRNPRARSPTVQPFGRTVGDLARGRSEEHTSELQSQFHLVCRLLLEKKNAEIRTPRPHGVEQDHAALLVRRADL